jgi:hypothetical protein
MNANDEKAMKNLITCLSAFAVVDKVAPTQSLEILRQCIEYVAPKTETSQTPKEAPSK